MFGWFSAAAARASCSKRRRRSGSALNAAGSTLMATSRPRRESWARYTSPMPPLPMSERSSYGPRRAQRVKGTVSEPADYTGLWSHGSPRDDVSDEPRTLNAEPYSIVGVATSSCPLMRWRLAGLEPATGSEGHTSSGQAGVLQRRAQQRAMFGVGDADMGGAAEPSS